jgi:hypothetical protein
VHALRFYLNNSESRTMLVLRTEGHQKDCDSEVTRKIVWTDSSCFKLGSLEGVLKPGGLVGAKSSTATMIIQMFYIKYLEICLQALVIERTNYFFRGL